jgi:hypothetical protein
LGLGIFREHPEIMTPSEKDEFKWNEAHLALAYSFIIFVQMPLTLTYFLRVRREPVKNRYLIKRLYMLPMISLPWSFYAEK